MRVPIFIGCFFLMGAYYPDCTVNALLLIKKINCSTVHCSQDGHTALHYAAREGYSEIVKLLLTAGAATDIPDKV